MGQQYDLSQFLVDPNRFAFDGPKSQISDEYMTELLAVDLPGNFNAARASDRYDEIMEEMDPDCPPHLFMVVGNNGLSNLLITFRDAVEIAITKDSIAAVLREEITACGYDGQTWKLKACPLTEDVFDTIYNFYVNGFDGPK